MVVRRTAPPDDNTATASTAASSNVRPLRRTNQNAFHAIPTLPAALLARRPRARPTTNPSSTSTTPVSATEEAEPEVEPERRGRGRRRTLPLMTNSERARYYRRKHAEETDALEAATVQLRREVLHLEIRLRIHRQLVAAELPPAALQRVFVFVQHFVEIQLHTMTHGLQEPRHEIVGVELRGDGTAPIIRVDALVRGRLATPSIHRIYPFVLGNTIVLDELMHQQLTFACAYLFYFTADGALQRESVQIDSILGLRGPLGNLATVARVVSDVDVHAEPDLASPAPRSRRRARSVASNSMF